MRKIAILVISALAASLFTACGGTAVGGTDPSCIHTVDRFHQSENPRTRDQMGFKTRSSCDVAVQLVSMRLTLEQLYSGGQWRSIITAPNDNRSNVPARSAQTSQIFIRCAYGSYRGSAIIVYTYQGQNYTSVRKYGLATSNPCA